MTDERCIYDIAINVLRNFLFIFFFQAEDGIRYLVRSRGLGDVYKRQTCHRQNQGVALDPNGPFQNVPERLQQTRMAPTDCSACHH